MDQVTRNNILSEDDQERLYCLLFDVRRSVRYHNRRRQFFDRVGKITDALSAIGGSGTIISVVSKSSIASIILATITAIFSAINLVFDTKGNSRLHHDLARQFISIEKNLINPLVTPEQIDKAELDRLDIETGEPPALRVLDLICYNELSKAMGIDENESYKIRYIQALFANFVDVFPSKIKKIAAKLT